MADSTAPEFQPTVARPRSDWRAAVTIATRRRRPRITPDSCHGFAATRGDAGLPASIGMSYATRGTGGMRCGWGLREWLAPTRTGSASSDTSSTALESALPAGPLAADEQLVGHFRKQFSLRGFGCSYSPFAATTVAPASRNSVSAAALESGATPAMRSVSTRTRRCECSASMAEARTQ